jgi:hypothetical protein
MAASGQPNSATQVIGENQSFVDKKGFKIAVSMPYANGSLQE